MSIKLQLFEAEDVISRKGGKGSKKSGARYANYSKRIVEHLPFLFASIDADKDHTIRVKLGDFTEACGMKMQKVADGKAVPGAGLNPTSAGWGFKYALFHAGIAYTMGKVEDGQPVMIMRRKTEQDVLPASLQPKTVEVAAEVAAGEEIGADAGEETVNN